MVEGCQVGQDWCSRGSVDGLAFMLVVDVGRVSSWLLRVVLRESKAERTQ